MKTFAASVKKPQVAVIGAGIAGLTAAYRLAQEGVKVTVYEATDRVGGKIRTSEERHGARHFEYGAEFINSDDQALIGLCKELGVKLQESASSESVDYAYLFSGERYKKSDLQRGYHALLEKVTPVIQECLRNDATANAYDAMPLSTFLDMMQSDSIDKCLIDVLRVASLHEGGNPLKHQSALAFLMNLNTESKRFAPFGVDDEAYWVKGGTSKIIQRLYKQCVKRGVQIVHKSPVLEIRHDKEKLTVHVDGAEDAEKFDHVVLATPLQRLCAIKGLHTVGLSDHRLEQFAATQHANAIKIGFALKGDPRVGTPLENVASLITDKNFQYCWHVPGNLKKSEDSPKHNTMAVMLIGGLNMQTDIPQLIEICKEEYAALLGKSKNDIFVDCEPEITIGSSASNGCYVSPAPGQFRQLQNLAQQPSETASIIGAHIPISTKHGGIKIGFMECAVRSAEQEAERIVRRLCPNKTKTRAHPRIHMAPTHSGMAAA